MLEYNNIWYTTFGFFFPPFKLSLFSVFGQDTDHRAAESFFKKGKA